MASRWSAAPLGRLDPSLLLRDRACWRQRASAHRGLGNLVHLDPPPTDRRHDPGHGSRDLGLPEISTTGRVARRVWSPPQGGLPRSVTEQVKAWGLSDRSLRRVFLRPWPAFLDNERCP